MGHADGVLEAIERLKQYRFKTSLPTLSKIESAPIISSTYSDVRQGASPDRTFLRRLSLAVVALGCLLRIVQYLLDRSLWMDEAYLSLNILHRSFAGLFHSLDYHQGAPVGFLLLEKSAVRLWGGSEYVLRLIPLLASLASVFLFYRLASKVLTPKTVPIVAGLFAISPALIYYSAEVKQYSSDVAIALLLYCLTIEGSKSEWKTRQTVLAALSGAIAIWMSHSSIFVLAGIGATISIALVLRKEWVKLARVCFVGLCWMASLTVCYLVTLRKLASDGDLLNYWTANFMPLPPRPVADFQWLVDSFFGFFSTSAGLKFSGLAALVFVLGSISMFRKTPERVFLLLSPAIITLLASGLHKYPFGGRLTLFLVPSALLLMAEGVEPLRSSDSTSLPVAGGVLIALLFIDPGTYTLHHFAKPHTEVAQPGVMLPEEMRPAVAYVRNHEKPDDLVYVFYGAEPAFEYYAERDNFPRNNVEIGTASGNDPRIYESELDRLRGRRAWVLLSHIRGVGAQDSHYVEFYLDSLGPRIDSLSVAGAEVYLYDLRNAASLPAAQSQSTH